MTKLTVTAFTITLMEPCMKADGEMTYNMERAKSLGLMVAFMKDSTWLGRSTGLDYTAGTMGPSTQGSGLKTKSKALAHTRGWTVDSIRVSGLTITWTEWVSTPGLTAGATWANTKMTKNTATASTNGPTGVSI